MYSEFRLYEVSQVVALVPCSSCHPSGRGLPEYCRGWSPWHCLPDSPVASAANESGHSGLGLPCHHCAELETRSHLNKTRTVKVMKNMLSLW